MAHKSCFKKAFKSIQSIVAKSRKFHNTGGLLATKYSSLTQNSLKLSTFGSGDHLESTLANEDARRDYTIWIAYFEM
jgi:hypothetical protein